MYILGELLASDSFMRYRNHTSILQAADDRFRDGRAVLFEGNKQGEFAVVADWLDGSAAMFHILKEEAFGVYWSDTDENFMLQHFRTGNTITLIGTLPAINDHPFQSDYFIFDLERKA